jgi:hypothetical protein
MLNAELDMRKRNLMQRMGIDNEERLGQIITMSGRSRREPVRRVAPRRRQGHTHPLVLDKLIAEGKF